MYITRFAGNSLFRVRLWKVKRKTHSDQLITFTGCLGQTLPIEDRDFPSAACNQTGTFQLPGSIRDGWPLDTQHFGEEVVSDQQCVIVAAVAHHEEPTRQPLFEAVGAVACYRHQYLFEKRVDVGVHESSEGWHRLHGA